MSTEPNALRDAPDNWQFADLGVRASRVDDKTLLVRGPKDVLDVLQGLFQDKAEDGS